MYFSEAIMFMKNGFYAALPEWIGYIRLDGKNFILHCWDDIEINLYNHYNIILDEYLDRKDWIIFKGL